MVWLSTLEEACLDSSSEEADMVIDIERERERRDTMRVGVMWRLLNTTVGGAEEGGGGAGDSGASGGLY